MHHGLHPQLILGSIYRNCFSFLMSFLYWRTSNWMPVLHLWFHRCQIERNNPFPWRASCTCADISTQFLFIAAGTRCWLLECLHPVSQSPVPAHGVILYQVYYFAFAFIELHNVSVIPFLLPSVGKWPVRVGWVQLHWNGKTVHRVRILWLTRADLGEMFSSLVCELHDSNLEVLALDI